MHFCILIIFTLFLPLSAVKFINHNEWHEQHQSRRQAPKPIPLPVIPENQVEDMLFGELEERPEARAALTYQGEPPGQLPPGDGNYANQEVQPREPYLEQSQVQPAHQPEYFPPEVPQYSPPPPPPPRQDLQPPPPNAYQPKATLKGIHWSQPKGASYNQPSQNPQNPYANNQPGNYHIPSAGGVSWYTPQRNAIGQRRPVLVISNQAKGAAPPQPAARPHVDYRVEKGLPIVPANPNNYPPPNPRPFESSYGGSWDEPYGPRGPGYEETGYPSNPINPPAPNYANPPARPPAYPPTHAPPKDYYKTSENPYEDKHTPAPTVPIYPTPQAPPRREENPYEELPSPPPQENPYTEGPSPPQRPSPQTPAPPAPPSYEETPPSAAPPSYTTTPRPFTQKPSTVPLNYEETPPPEYEQTPPRGPTTTPSPYVLEYTTPSTTPYEYTTTPGYPSTTSEYVEVSEEYPRESTLNPYETTPGRPYRPSETPGPTPPPREFPSTPGPYPSTLPPFAPTTRREIPTTSRYRPTPFETTTPPFEEYTTPPPFRTRPSPPPIFPPSPARPPGQFPSPSPPSPPGRPPFVPGRPFIPNIPPFHPMRPIPPPGLPPASPIPPPYERYTTPPQFETPGTPSRPRPTRPPTQPPPSERMMVPNRIRGKAQVVCLENGIEFKINTLFPFTGQIFAHDKKRVQECMHVFEHSFNVSVTLPFEQCGVANPGDDTQHQTYHMQIIVMIEQPDGSTSIQSFMAQCVEQRVLYKKKEIPKRIEEALEELRLVPEKLEQKAPTPEVRMKIVKEVEHHRKGDGEEVDSVEIGTPLRVEWSLEPESDAHGFLVRNCIVRDMVSGVEHQVIDEKGCSTDINIFAHPHYDTYHDIARVHWHAFKVPDSSQLSIKCDFQICVDIPDASGKTSCEAIPTPPYCADLITSPMNSILFDVDGNLVKRQARKERSMFKQNVHTEICLGDANTTLCERREVDTTLTEVDLPERIDSQKSCPERLWLPIATGFSMTFFIFSLGLNGLMRRWRARRRVEHK